MTEGDPTFQRDLEIRGEGDLEWCFTVHTPRSPEYLDASVGPTVDLVVHVSGDDYAHRLPTLTLSEADCERLIDALVLALETERIRATRQGFYVPEEP